MKVLSIMIVIGVSLGALPRTTQAEPLKINGSTTVNLVVAEAAEILRAEQGMDIQVDTQGGSMGGISALGDGLVDVGMSSRPLYADDRDKFPNADFHAVSIGGDAVALVVSREVWEGGVRALSKTEMRGIYEGRITNWKQLGGPDRRIVFFNKEPGRGTWEVFAQWLYGDVKQAPLVSLLEVGGNEEGRNKVSSTLGAISLLSAAWADNKQIFVLGIVTDGGNILQPTAENIASGTYPMSRPLFVLTRGAPRGDAKILVDFMLSPRGQDLVRKHGYLALNELTGRCTKK